MENFICSVKLEAVATRRGGGGEMGGECPPKLFLPPPSLFRLPPVLDNMFRNHEFLRAMAVEITAAERRLFSKKRPNVAGKS